MAAAIAHNKTSAQICLKWVLQLGHPLITSTAKADYMADDLVATDPNWALSDQEMASINDLVVGSDDPVKSMCLL